MRLTHDDVIKWKHFPRYWPFVRGIHRSPVNSPYKGQWRGALMFSMNCIWIKDWVNNREAGDLRRHRAHYDVTLMPTLKRMIQSRICTCDIHWLTPHTMYGNSFPIGKIQLFLRLWRPGSDTLNSLSFFSAQRHWIRCTYWFIVNCTHRSKYHYDFIQHLLSTIKWKPTFTECCPLNLGPRGEPVTSTGIYTGGNRAMVAAATILIMSAAESEHIVCYFCWCVLKKRTLCIFSAPEI